MKERAEIVTRGHSLPLTELLQTAGAETASVFGGNGR